VVLELFNVFFLNFDCENDILNFAVWSQDDKIYRLSGLDDYITENKAFEVKNGFQALILRCKKQPMHDYWKEADTDL
jgi:hypothetical protein